MTLSIYGKQKKISFNKTNTISLTIFTLLAFLFFSCTTTPQKNIPEEKEASITETAEIAETNSKDAEKISNEGEKASNEGEKASNEGEKTTNDSEKTEQLSVSENNTENESHKISENQIPMDNTNGERNVIPIEPINTKENMLLEPEVPVEKEIQNENLIDEKYFTTEIAGYGTKDSKQLMAFFKDNNPLADEEKVKRLADYYIEEGYIEGINSDVAFVQMCLETGFLRFGGLVTESMNNFCGLGSIDENHKGEVFPTEQIGVRAHIQHLHAYCTDTNLTQALVDNRYKYVKPRGKAPSIYELAGTWAADKSYSVKLYDLLERLSLY